MSLYAALTRPGPTGFGYATTAEKIVGTRDLTGLRVLITGVNSGLGAETARALARAGATIVGLARTADKATAAVTGLGNASVGVACELSDPHSVREAVKELRAGPPLDVVIANAGIMALPSCQVMHAHELQFLTNHLGHFGLITGLLDHLTPTARVVMLSSAAHRMAPTAGIDFENLAGERGYSAWRFYGQSKLANALFARSLSTRFEGSARLAFAVHPGVIDTGLGRHTPALFRLGTALARPLFLKTIPQGAATQVFAAIHPAAIPMTGQYLSDCNLASASPSALDSDIAERLWRYSEGFWRLHANE